MKKVIQAWAVVMLPLNSLLATDIVVDPSLSSGNGVDLFPTISSAIAVAEDGDRILITPGVYQEAALNISNSLSLLPTDGQSDVTINANVTVNVADDRIVQWVHMNLGQYHLTVSGGAARFGMTMLNCQVTNLTINSNGAMTPGDRCEMHIIDCEVDGSLSMDQNGWDLGLFRTNVDGTVTYRFGDIAMCSMPRLVLKDESGGNSLENRHAIIQNSISEYLEIRNDNCPVRIANNSLKNLYLFLWNHTADHIDILNNEFASGTHIHMPWNPPAWNLRFNNNIFATNPTFMRWAVVYGGWNNTNYFWCDSHNSCGGTVYGNPGNQLWNGPLPLFGSQNLYDCSSSDYCHGADIGSNVNFWSTGTAAFPNPSIAGFFEWNYNSHSLPQPGITSSHPIVYTEVGNGGQHVDGGSPQHEYYDLDLTINDRGRDGGPWGTANFPADGKSFIFDLDIPADLFPGQEIDIKAKAYQRY